MCIDTCLFPSLSCEQLSFRELKHLVADSACCHDVDEYVEAFMAQFGQARDGAISFEDFVMHDINTRLGVSAFSLQFLLMVHFSSVLLPAIRRPTVPPGKMRSIYWIRTMTVT